jgi:predicted  nucleic acid-binding Zn-ribbon protein
MTNSKNLDEAVEKFQRAEEAIKEVADELAALAISTKKFEDARLDLKAARAELGSLATTHAELSTKLADLSKNLSETTEVVRKIDPARLYAELGSIRQDYQSQIERIGKLSGDLSSSVLTSAERTSALIGESREQLSALTTTSNSNLRRLLYIGLAVSVSTCALQIATLVAG